MNYEFSDKSTPEFWNRLQLAVLCPEHELNVLTATRPYYADEDNYTDALRLRCQIRLKWADMMIAEAQKH